MSAPSTRRRMAQGARRAYHGLLGVLPARVARPFAAAVSRIRLAQDIRRGPAPLVLPGSAPVTLVDARGVDRDRLDEIAEVVAAGPSPCRRILLIDRPDFLGLRTLGLSFEYLPSREASRQLFAEDDAYAAFVERRMAEIRQSYAIERALDRSFVGDGH